MTHQPIHLGSTPCPTESREPAASFTEIDGEPYAAITDVDGMPPFFMNVVGAGDVWLFAGSNGPFTAGRVEPDCAIFPYQTVDKILRDPTGSGSMTVMLVHRDGGWRLWEPWQGAARPYRVHRNLYKHLLGCSVIFEEINDDLAMRFRWSLATCESYGLVRRCVIENLCADETQVRCLDGWSNLLPAGVTQESYARLSYLAAGYMRHERVPVSVSRHTPGSEPALALYTLNAAIADRAEALESLRCTAAFGLGHHSPTVLLCARQVDAFRRGEPLHTEDEVRGEFGAFLVADAFTLGAGKAHAWMHAADTQLDPPAVVRLRSELADATAITSRIESSVLADREVLRDLIAGADGMQLTADASAGAHHTANVLFNCMRGGTFADGGRFPRADLAAFLRVRSTAVADEHAAWLQSLPDRVALEDLEATSVPDDPHLRRLVGEYLPVTFSRRHGDPSRPWNHFAIRVKAADGSPVLSYQGNWRDIFQNWESLGQSYPAAIEPMIATFLSASTADGYNPYRITREGIDWEVHNPGDAWGHYGYWGDHQIVYLLRLLESLARFRPGRLSSRLAEERCAYAHVPYEIAGFDALLRDPKNSIAFNHERHRQLMARAAASGGDGKLLSGADGRPLLVSLAEKLLVPLIAKLTNLVPDGGIWLNTQRPEWNDANNGLAGWGLSVVTTCYMRRYLVFLQSVLAAADKDDLSLSTPVAELLRSVAAALATIGPAEGRRADRRYEAMESLGRAGEAYRGTLYRDGLVGRTAINVSEVQAMLAAALAVVDETIRANRRPDGLYHSYNILHLDGKGGAEVRRLAVMLEGQVAVLSSGMLSPEECLVVTSALRASDLYRADQNSYLLYPDRVLPSYLDRNTLPAGAADRAPVVNDLIAGGDSSVVTVDANGGLHFSASLRNASDLAERLADLKADDRWREPVVRDRGTVMELWEEVFRHSEFTGRSGAFFMFEGLGSIYWHMVAKLLVAVQECWQHAVDAGADPSVVAGLARAYFDIRDGLGYRKPPAVYGAFPTDPYSHTPGHRGAQQPGMTGQVKEEILTRWGELGVRVKQGRLSFEPRLLSRSEFMEAHPSYEYTSVGGERQAWSLPAGSLAFTHCGLPVCYTLGDRQGITVERADGSSDHLAESTLGLADSQSVFARDGGIARVSVYVRADELVD